MFPRSLAQKLGIRDIIEHISWYPNKTEGSGLLHQKLHQALREVGLPTQGSKYTGSLDEAFEKMTKAYKDFDDLGTLKLNGVKYKNVKLGKALEIIRPICQCK